MPLTLAPSFDEHTRDQIEAHVDAVRARRMVAVVEYHNGVNAKLHHESLKLQHKIAKQYEMLGKEIDRLEAAEEKVLARLETLEALRQQTELIGDMQSGPLKED